MDCEGIVFSGHALKRMFEGAIGEGDVLAVVVARDHLRSRPGPVGEGLSTE